MTQGTEPGEAPTGLKRFQYHWTDILIFSAFVVFGATFLAEPTIVEKAAAPLSLAGLVVTSSAVSIVLFMLRERAATASKPTPSPSFWRLICYTDVLLLVALAVTVLPLDQIFYPIDRPSSEFLKAFTYLAVIVVGFAAVRKLRKLRELHEAYGLAQASAEQPLAPSPSRPNHPDYAEAEGHYVKLVYPNRVEHRRARFRDVVDTLGDSGLQVQKSFWVRRDAVAALRRSGRQLNLVLSSGAEIPVGRTNERSVMAAFPQLQGMNRA